MHVPKNKWLIIITAILFICSTMPSKTASAASITNIDLMTISKFNYIVGGFDNLLEVISDAAIGTTMTVDIDYSIDNGVSWRDTIQPMKAPSKSLVQFRLPESPEITSVKLRFRATFNPLIGTVTHSERIIGPYRVFQPGEPTNLIASDMIDGGIRLQWDDNSNMESSYSITRYGSDGTQYFSAEGTTDHVGTLTYEDHSTIADKVYLYDVMIVYDQKNEPAKYFQNSSIKVLTKAKKAITPSDITKDNGSILISPSLKFPIIRLPDLNKDNPGSKNDILNKDLWSVYVTKDDLKISDIFVQSIVTSISLLNRQVEITDKQTYQLQAIVHPTTALNKTTTWYSDNPAVATIDNKGLVTGIAPGDANITVKTEEGGFIDKATVKVTSNTAIPDKVTSVSLNVAQVNITEKQTYQLQANVEPNTAINNKVSWSSSNTAIAVVNSNGVVTGVAPGEAMITVKTEDGGFMSSAVTKVTKIPEVPVLPEPIIFSDTVGHWAKDEIHTAYKLGIVLGYDKTTFKPNGSVTREEFAVMLMKAIKPSIAAAPLTFSDSSKISEWARASIEQAVALHIIVGYPQDNTFRPRSNITHAEMISMIVRASKLELHLNKQTTYADNNAIPDWAKPSIATAQNNNIVFGNIIDNKFNPTAISTRAEAASSIVRMISLPKL